VYGLPSVRVATLSGLESLPKLPLKRILTAVRDV
jgi:hypothetical protein